MSSEVLASDGAKSSRAGKSMVEDKGLLLRYRRVFLISILMNYMEDW
jgi:hypothetical protein